MNQTRETFTFDTVVIGGGVVGTSIGARVSQDRSVLLIERNQLLGAETSSRSSEVIHAGIYYDRNSLKSIHCINGRHLLYKYLEKNKVPYKKIGKIIVGNKLDEITLSKIYEAAKLNGVERLEYLSKKQIQKLEPDVSAYTGLLSPDTGIFDSHQLIQSLGSDIIDNNGMILLGAQIKKIRQYKTGYKLSITETGEQYYIKCRHLIIAAGHSTLGILKSIDGVHLKAKLEQRFAKGHYATVNGKTNFNHLIYPVPEKNGLGVHLTLDMHGAARFGPNVVWTDTYDVSTHDFDPVSFTNSIKKYWPSVADRCLTPAYAGSRPKILFNGGLATDFIIAKQNMHSAKNVIAMLSIESPGLTSALSLAELIAKQINEIS